jgi:4'-phosphopantetheinyl transferase
MPASTQAAWAPGPARPQLREGEVHVWRAELGTVGDQPAELLCDEEQERAARLLRARDRQLWTRGRGVLRRLLGGYLASDPRTLRFATEAHGKPSLIGHAQLSFNLSHSGGLALYAFTTVGPVGVDIELARRPIDAVALAARAFGPGEAARLAALDPATRSRELLRAWTRHEAALKRLGVGIRGGIRDDAGRGGDCGARGDAPEPWIAELDIGPQGAAAVAVEPRPRVLRCWDWPTSPAPGAARGSSR